MITALDHIAIAVSDLEGSLAFYRDVLGLPCDGIEVVPEQKVRVALIRVGGVRIELMEPTEADSPISRFLAKRGNGLHHIALRTDRIETQLDALADGGVELIDRHARTGAEGHKVAFVHPRAAHGVLLELTQTGEH